MAKMDFDPNSISSKKKTKVYEYATYIPGRRPEFKVHWLISHAKSAFQYRNDAILFRLEDGEWKELYRIEDYSEPDNCDNCEVSLWAQYPGSKPYRRGRRIWKPRENKLIFVCYDCLRKIRR